MKTKEINQWKTNKYIVQFSRSVVSNSLRSHESQHARPRCPSPTSRVYSNSCPSSQWCHPYWSFSFIIRASNKYPGLISFTMDWLDLLAVQGTLKSLLQHHSSKALYHIATFFLVKARRRTTMTQEWRCGKRCKCSVTVVSLCSHRNWGPLPCCLHPIWPRHALSPGKCWPFQELVS